MYTFIPYSKKLTSFARENRKNPTEAEKKVWYKVLKTESLKKYKFLRQKPIDNFIADFYCSELRLVIEIDGDTHSESDDQDRTKILETYGLHVVRYTIEKLCRLSMECMKIY